MHKEIQLTFLYKYGSDMPWLTPALNKLIDPQKGQKNVFLDSFYVT